MANNNDCVRTVNKLFKTGCKCSSCGLQSNTYQAGIMISSTTPLMFDLCLSCYRNFRESWEIKGVLLPQFSPSAVYCSMENPEILAKCLDVATFKTNNNQHRESTIEELGEMMYHTSLNEKETHWTDNNNAV